jgi:hypothetical protein
MSYVPSYMTYPNYQPNKVLISNRSRLANYGEIFNTSNNDDIVTYQTAAEDEDHNNSNNTRAMTVIPTTHLQAHNSFYQPRQFLTQTVIPQPLNYTNYSQPIIAQPVIAQDPQPTSYLQQLPVGINQNNVVYQSHPQLQQFNRNNMPILHYTSNFTHGRIPAQIINYPADPVPAAPTYYTSPNQSNIVYQRRSNVPFIQYQYQ